MKTTWFNVIKSGRIVDCVKAKTIGMALQKAMDVWDKACEKQEHSLTVEPTPPKKVPIIVKPSLNEVKEFGGVRFETAGSKSADVQFVNPVARVLGIK